MRNLKVWQKLVLVGIVFIIPFAVVSYRMVSSIDALAIQFARQELRGLEYYTPAVTLLKDVQLHRGVLNGSRAGQASFTAQISGARAAVERDLAALDDIDRRLGSALGTTERWTVLRDACRELLAKSAELPAEESFARHSRLLNDLLNLIATVGHASNLAHDAGNDRNQLIQVLLFEGPQLSETLARARGVGIGMTGAKESAQDVTEALRRSAVLAEFQSAKLDEVMEAALQSDDTLRAELGTHAGDTSNAVLDALSAIVTRGSAGPAQSADFFAVTTKGIESIGALQTKIAGVVSTRLNEQIWRLQRDIASTLLWAGLGLLALVAIAVYIMRDITATLRQAVHAANRIAVGDLSAPASSSTRKDELGVLSQAFERMVGTLNETVGLAQRIAAGDLTITAQPRSELDVMGRALANMVERLAGLVAEMQRSGIQVNASVNEIAATARQQQATATEIAATTTQIGATSREISATSKELVRTMNEVSDGAVQAAMLAGSGQEGLIRMEDTMRQLMEAAGSINAKLAVLNQKAGNITQVVTTITKVADQTNLLSLNAAIEAEKAGEYGRGFAVVATEIRRLADQTAVATFDIEQMVKEIQTAVAAGVMGMDKFSEEVRRGIQDVHQVGNQLSQIIQQVQTLAPRFEAVNEGMQAQATGAEQITNGLTQLTEAAQQTVESLHQSNLVIDGLNHAATQMRAGVSRFTIAA
jgi:methyl-accepting chemotaxis protein WspA